MDEIIIPIPGDFSDDSAKATVTFQSETLLKAIKDLASLETDLKKAPTISSGATAPSSIPSKIGDLYIDTTNKKTYIAKGTSSSEDWVLQASSALEARHYVGTTGEPAFQNNWVNYGGSNEPANFYKDNFGMVHIAGQIKGGSGFNPAFTLPVGYRPPYNSSFSPTVSNNSFGYVSIQADGTVYVAGSTTWLSLNIAPFRVD